MTSRADARGEKIGAKDVGAPPFEQGTIDFYLDFDGFLIIRRQARGPSRDYAILANVERTVRAHIEESSTGYA